MSDRAPDPPGVAARRTALRLVDAVLRRGLPLDATLDRAAAGLDRADDRALAVAIAAETLRRLPDLDALIDSATRVPLAADAKARTVLRIALIQLLALDTPPHAAIATALPLVDRGPRKLVHGVFSTLARRGVTLPATPTLPAAVEQRWRSAWGAAATSAAARAIALPPPLDLSLADPGQTSRVAAELGGVSLLAGHVRLASSHVPDLPGFADGGWWVQDIAASLPARIVGAGTGTVLDCCAAPGGKTLQLSAAGWQVTAVDASESRLARLSANLARNHLAAAVVAADLLDWAPAAAADAVLLDAPCSATGIFRRHPDVLHRVGTEVIARLATLQTRLLARVADWVAVGGVLVYAVCSLEPEEGEARVVELLATRGDYRLDPADPALLPAGVVPDPRGWVRVLPGMIDPGGCDGFFIARLRRVG